METVEEKKGLWGRDGLYINLQKIEENGLVSVTPFTVFPTKGGNIAFSKSGQEPIIINKDSVRQIFEWLESWGYI